MTLFDGSAIENLGRQSRHDALSLEGERLRLQSAATQLHWRSPAALEFFAALDSVLLQTQAAVRRLGELAVALQRHSETAQHRSELIEEAAAAARRALAGTGQFMAELADVL